VVGGLAADRGSDDTGPAGQDLAGLGADPLFGVGVAFGVKTPGGFPHVFQDVDEVDHDRDGEPAGAGLGADPVDLVGVAVDQGHPGALMAGVAAVGFGEPGRDHRGGVVGDAGGQPLPGRAHRRPAFGLLVGVVGQDVRDGARCRGQVVHGGDLSHALTVAFLTFGQPGGQLLTGRGLRGRFAQTVGAHHHPLAVDAEHQHVIGAGSGELAA
jgi:hypothetical protein